MSRATCIARLGASAEAIPSPKCMSRATCKARLGASAEAIPSPKCTRGRTAPRDACRVSLGLSGGGETGGEIQRDRHSMRAHLSKHARSRSTLSRPVRHRRGRRGLRRRAPVGTDILFKERNPTGRRPSDLTGLCLFSKLFPKPYSQPPCRIPLKHIKPGRVAREFCLKVSMIVLSWS